MKWGKIVALLLVTIIVIVGAVLAVNPLKESINLGLDLKGGVQVRLQAQGEVTDLEISQVIAIMRNRVDKLGVTEPIIQQEGTDRILIELPGVKDPETAINMIGKTAQLEFVTAEGMTVLTGKDVKDAQEGKDAQTGEVFIGLSLNDEGTKKFADITTQLVSQYPEVNNQRDERRIIAIVLDEDVLTAPYVMEPITTGEGARITGFVDLKEAHNTAVLLRSGALPVPVEIIEKRTLGPTLGADSIVKSTKAGLWGIVIIMIF
ncbi:MAG: protein translocase subunit SecD, partial [Firmicutes bacterium HGW-Firmicutes-12]